jgi:hypothetical protein
MKTFLTLLILIPNLSWSFTKSPLEICMDRVIEGTFEGDESRSIAAATVCAGADKAILKCMDRVIEGTFNGDEKRSIAAAVACTGNNT